MFLGQQKGNPMKWYYNWKLKKIHAEIDALTKRTGFPLSDNYTDLSRLRSLNRLAAHLQERLAKYPNSANPDQAAPPP